MSEGITISNLLPAAALSGAELIAVVQSGATCRTTATDLLGSRNAVTGEYPVANFGAVGNGIADDSAAINAAIVAAGTAGGGTVQLGYNHAIAHPLICNYSNVVLRGFGGDQSHIVGDQAGEAGTTVTWTGAAGANMLLFASPQGAAAQKKRGGGAVGIYFSGNSIAGRGLYILSWVGAAFTDLYFAEFTVACIELDVVQTLGDNRSTQENHFTQIYTRQVVQSAPCLLMRSSYIGGNPSLNTFHNLQCQIKNGPGIKLYNCDTNLFIQPVIHLWGVGPGNGLEIHGNNDVGGGPYVPRYNVFLHYAAGPIVAYGTETYLNPAGPNIIDYLDFSDGQTDPVVGTGTSIIFSYDNGTQHLKPTIGAISARFNSEVTYAQDAYAGGALASHTFVSDGNTHTQYLTSSGNKWLGYLDLATGDFRFVLGTGGTVSSSFNIGPGASGGYAIAGIKLVGRNGQFYAVPAAAPANPATGWVLYCDSGDLNKLKAKASTGTIVTLGTP